MASLARAAAVLALLSRCLATVLVATNLRVDFLPAGTQAVIVSSAPEFSWVPLDSSGHARALEQAAYQLQVSIDAAFSTVVFDSGLEQGNATKLAVAAVAGVAPDTPVYWRVRVGGSDDGATSAWAVSTFHRGLLPGDFSAQWIVPNSTRSADAPVRFRAVVATVPAGAVRATVYVASPCYWHLFSSGTQLDAGSEMGPWTTFESRILYSTFNVTGLLQEGAPLVLGIRVASGPYGVAKFGFPFTGAPLLLELRIVLANGSTAVYATGGSDGALRLSAHPDSITAYDWYNGEVVDARLEAPLEGWDSPGYNETGRGWEAVAPFTGVGSAAELTPHDFGRIERVAVFSPVARLSPSPGVYSFSFAQNFAGFVELDVPTAGAAGITVSLYAGELLSPSGHVINQLNTSTNMTLSWTLQGPAAGPLETVRPSFVFWGFQHVEIVGWPAAAAPPSTSNVRGVAISTLDDEHVVGSITSIGGVAPSASIAAAFRRAALDAPSVSPSRGELGAAPPRASQALGVLNSSILAGIYHATLWSQRNNFQSLPSDCPNREKRGWMGDGAVSAAQAVWNFDMAATYRSWFRSMRDDQEHIANAHPGLAGLLSSIVPNSDPPPKSDDASWGVAIAEAMFQVVVQFNDTATLRATYPAIRSYLGYLSRCTDPKLGIMINQSIWGDWDAAFARADYVPVTAPICATANMMHIAQLLVQLAPLAGFGEDVPGYEALLASSVTPFNDYYALNLNNGTYVDGTEQTPALMALVIGFVPDEHVAATQNWLIHDVETTRGVHLSTGATGTRYLFEQLSDMGRTDLAAAVAAQDSFPSHGYWVVNGGTTCWENWSGDADEQHPPPPTHDHIFLCSSTYWFYTTLLGIRQPPMAGSLLSVGFAAVTMAPPLIDSLPSMAGSVRTVRGSFALSWAWTGPPMTSTMRLNASVPANSRATVMVPVPGLASPIVTESGLVVWANGTFRQAPGILSAAVDPAGYVAFSVASGDFVFSTSDEAGWAPGGAHRVARCAALQAASEPRLDLTCPPGLRLSHILRAGVVADAAAARAFAAGEALDATAVRHRFLVAHALERLCIQKPGGTRQGCEVTAHGLAQAMHPVDALAGASASESVCAIALCSAW